MKRTAMFSALAALLLSPAVAKAAPTQPIGSAVRVVNEVSASFDQDRRDLKLDDEIHQDELIEVGQDSIGELQFADETKMALGPGARLLLDRFVYNGEKSKGDIVVDLVKGAFRFITGVAAKPSYRIRTPGAAITVRGTIFDVYVLPDDSAWFLLLDGGITACNDRGGCKDLSEVGSLLRVSPSGEISGPLRWAWLPGKDTIGFSRAFPFMVNAPTINPDLPVTREAVLDPVPPPTRNTMPRVLRKKASKDTKSRPKKRRVQDTTRKSKTRTAKKRPSSNKPNQAAANAAKAAIAIGIGIGIGKALSGGKKSNHYDGGGHNRYGKN
jgi:FecR protein